MSSNDLEGINILFSFFWVTAGALDSSMASEGRDLLSLMLLMVVATLGIALLQTHGLCYKEV